MPQTSSRAPMTCTTKISASARISDASLAGTSQAYPGRGTSSRSGVNPGAHPREREHGLRRVGALVALAAARAHERLLEVFDRQHAEAARHAGAQRDLLDAARGLVAD